MLQVDICAALEESITVSIRRPVKAETDPDQHEKKFYNAPLKLLQTVNLYVKGKSFPNIGPI